MRFTHLVLLVQLERAYLVDVGFGNGFLEPLPLEEGTRLQGFLHYHLERLDASWWRYRQFHGGPSFDFTLEPCQLSSFAAACHTLQTSPESGFVQTSVCHRFSQNGILTLRGATLRRINAEGVREEVLETPAAYAWVLREDFGLEPDDLDTLWDKVWWGHLAWLGAQA
jgi:N-hydroxyarylamine O-acetyltransferase